MRARNLVLVVTVGLVGCSGGSSSDSTSAPAVASASTATSRPASRPSSRPTHVPAVPVGWIAEDVTVPTALGPIAGTWTHRADTTTAPAALIIGGSGPTDRDGNSAADPAVIDNLEALANWLAADGMATLRSDKPGSGKTGAGNLTPATAARITVDDYLTMNAQLLAFVAARPGVDPTRISIVGHSEGALFALLLGAGHHGAATAVTPVRSLAMLEPQSLPILDILTAQVTDQVSDAEGAGAVTATQADALLSGLAAAVAAIRGDTPLPADLPRELAGLFTPIVLTYLRTEDAIDPRDVATSLPAGMPVLISCSDADIQITCDEVEQLAAAAGRARADVTFVHLTDVAHTLKVDPSRTGRDYGADLPFSPALRAALSTWASP